MNNRVFFFDTTLRDGEQSPGATMNLQEKLRIAHQLEVLGVDIMEAGFPASSPGDFEAVRRIAEQAGDIQVAGLASHQGGPASAYSCVCFHLSAAHASQTAQKSR